MEERSAGTIFLSRWEGMGSSVGYWDGGICTFHLEHRQFIHSNKRGGEINEHKYRWIGSCVSK